MIAVDTLYGKHKTSNNPVCHVWHPTIIDTTKGFSRLWEYQQSAGSNDYLAKQYRVARGDAEAMRREVGRKALKRRLHHSGQPPWGHPAFTAARSARLRPHCASGAPRR